MPFCFEKFKISERVPNLTYYCLCYNICITKGKEAEIPHMMIIKIDFNSDEALYMQLRNQIILGIASSQFEEGEALPSVRQLADMIGINMHTVNKAYSVLRQEGFIKVDRRRGAVIALDIDKLRTIEEMRKELQVVLAKGRCKGVTREEIHALIDDLYEQIGRI